MNKLGEAIGGAFNLIKNLIVDFFTSGTKENELDYNKRNKIIFINIAMFISIFVLVYFSVTRLAEKEYILSSFELAFVGLIIFFLWYLRKTRKTTVTSLVTVSALFALCVYLIYTGGSYNSGSYWIFAFPIIAITFLGARGGIIYGIIMLIIGATMMYTDLHLETANYYEYRTNVSIGVYLLIFLMAITYEVANNYSNKRLMAVKNEIQSILDNIQDGVFLMDRNYLIQSTSCSKSLFDILNKESFENYTFFDFLKDSNTLEKTCESVKAHLHEVFEGNIDEELLEDINPLSSIGIDMIKNEELIKRHLNFKFKKINKDGKPFLLVNVKDITKEVLLGEKLEKEIEEGDNQIKYINQIINTEIKLVKEFITESVIDLDDINTEFGNNSDDTTKVLQDLASMAFQKIHNIKGNAGILGFENIVNKLHNTEEIVKDLRKKDDIIAEDFLEITTEIQEIGIEINKIEEIIKKLESYKLDEEKASMNDPVILTITSCIDKLNDSRSMNVKLNIERFNIHLIKDVYRKLFKDSLIQLIRNSFAHGFEEKEERIAKGKNPDGCIEIISYVEDEKLFVIYKDDGKGLNINRIKAKAKTLEEYKGVDLENMSKKEAVKLIFAPGFSTTEDVDKTSGRGMGMNIIHDYVVKKNKGKINIQSEDGVNLAFKIELPL